MKFVLVLLLVVCGFYRCESQIQVPEEILGCVNTTIEALAAATGQLRGFAEWSIDALQTAQKLLEHRRRCDSIPRSDPPTAIQRRRIEACELTLRASATYEAARLAFGLTKIGVQSQRLVDEFKDDFIACFEMVPLQK